ncbi:MAG: hypothetical protein ACXADY_07400 [Candidatus Hodarchaeales archaeon]|jgi:hypothetical protein
MELYVVCQNCREKTSTTFSYCQKCGAKLSLVEETTQSSQEIDLPSGTQEKTDIESIEAETLSSSASSDNEKLKLTFTTENPITTYRIDRKVLSTMKTLDVMLLFPLIIKMIKRKYVINDMNEREFMNVTGGLLFLSKVLIFFWFVLIFLGTNYMFWQAMFGNLNPFLLMIIWGIGITIPFVIIGLLFDVFIFTVQNADGSPMGEIKSNLTGSSWKILGSSNETLARIKLRSAGLNPFKTIKMRTGEMKTPLGSFKAEAPVRDVSTSQYKYYIATKCYVTDSNGNPCFTLTWEDPASHPEYGREYRIDTQGNMTPFLTFTISVCLIDKFMSKIKSYDHTPDGGCGCE